MEKPRRYHYEDTLVQAPSEDKFISLCGRRFYNSRRAGDRTHSRGICLLCSKVQVKRKKDADLAALPRFLNCILREEWEEHLGNLRTSESEELESLQVLMHKLSKELSEVRLRVTESEETKSLLDNLWSHLEKGHGWGEEVRGVEHL